jgi:hypothetical protein
MQVTNEQVAVLRAFLEGDPEAEQLARPMATAERAGAFGSLLYVAFSHAVRNRFSPTWTSEDVVSFVASTRLAFLESGVEINPTAAETLIREALGEPVTSDFDPAVFLLVLVQVIVAEELDDIGLTVFLADARMDADARLARAGRNCCPGSSPLRRHRGA